jgi:excisionase family DNA binding protein
MSDDSGPRAERMLTVDDVATELKISARQAYALVRSGDLPAIRVGGRGQWRVERDALEEWIKEAYEATRRYIADNPPDPTDPADEADEVG